MRPPAPLKRQHFGMRATGAGGGGFPEYARRKPPARFSGGRDRRLLDLASADLARGGCRFGKPRGVAGGFAAAAKIA